MSMAQQEQVRERLQAGLCVWCGAPRGDDARYCLLHRQRMRQLKLRYYHEKEKVGAPRQDQIARRVAPQELTLRVPKPATVRYVQMPEVCTRCQGLMDRDSYNQDEARCLLCGHRAFALVR